jgi:hypothetical protein
MISNIKRKLSVYDITGKIHDDIRMIIDFFEKEIATLVFKDEKLICTKDGYTRAIYTYFNESSSKRDTLRITSPLDKGLANIMTNISIHDERYLFKYAFNKYLNIKCKWCIFTETI